MVDVVVAEERPATPSDYAAFGARFGVFLADEANRKRAAGESNEQIRAYVIAGLIPVKDSQLRQIGATDAEIGTFMRSAATAAWAALGGVDLLGILSRRQRRAMRHARGKPTV